ncbi:MAG: DUF4388 domain-containing protein [Holophagaceae bacterium]|nr:DUF4388 domain-containing protein [Holophagaceae bacterium]
MSQGLIQGSMREAPLPDIIQLVSQGSKTGCFNVVDDSRRAKIYLKDGRIIHAVSSTTEGLDAFYEVALWLDGSYTFEEGDQNISPTITKPNASILMEMGRRMDEWRVISQKITSLDLYPISMLLPGETPTGVNPREAKLLGIVTGWYSVAELAEVTQKPVLTVAKDLYGLAMAGHITLKGVRSGKRPVIDVPNAPAAQPEPAAEPVQASSEPPKQEAPQGFPLAEDSGAFPSAIASGPISTPPPVSAAPTHHITVPAPPMDPVRMAKYTAFTQRISVTAKQVLPVEHHEMVNRLQAKATQSLLSGGGPDAVKEMALGVSRSAVDAGADAELVKSLNAQLKALFSSK